jgi:hypothetical protein
VVSVTARTYSAGYCGFPIYAEPERSKNFVLDRTTNPDGTVIEETSGQLSVDIAGRLAAARVSCRPFYDPDNVRLR